MSHDGPIPEHAPAEGSRRSDDTGRHRGTRRTMLAGAGAAVIAAAGATLAGCGATKKKTASTSTSSTTSSATSGQPGTGAATGGQTTMLSVNGKSVAVSSSPGTMLLYVLLDELGLRGPKFGCGLSECGACAVLADGKQIRSCVTPLSSVGSQKIVTLEGLANSYDGPGKTDDGQLHPLQQAWIDEQVPQCGYCQNGMIIQAADLLSTKKSPTTAEIKQNMNGHLCRCGTYNGIVRAIHRAAGEMA
jgi:aerobic-type carbon monoxide dehydrogenase small subunit (CoxS/CutS family)